MPHQSIARSLFRGSPMAESIVKAGALLACALLGASLYSTAADASGFRHGFLNHRANADRGGIVYVMTNASSGNEILVFVRDHRGRLAALPRATASTGGLGGSITAPVDPLGSQGALVYDEASNLLFAVNAGDNTVAAFDTGPIGLPLRLKTVVASGGFIPVSVAVSGDLLYVLNAGGTASVTTFAIGEHGDLTQIGALDLGVAPTATEPPFDQVPAPGQVGVDTLARHLIVTHAGGQELLTAELDDDGVPMAPLVATSTPGAGTFAFGTTPFGSTLVAEAATGSVSAFDPPAANQPLRGDGQRRADRRRRHLLDRRAGQRICLCE